jgi:hypothetical protein
VIIHIGELGMMGNIPKSLQDAIQANILIPVVGAGVSMSIRDKEGNRVFPSWKELLERAADRLVSEAKEDDAIIVRSYLKKGNYQKAAEAAYEGLQGEVWFKFFEDQFYKNFNDLDGSSAALPKVIWKLAKKIITLNYDKIMEWGYGNAAQVNSLDNNSTADLADFQRQENDKPTVWHLHGKIDNRSELILTAESYKKLYVSENSGYKAALETLRSLNVTYSFLFVGCSLDDAEILHEIDRQQELFSGNSKKHFALVHKDQESAIKLKLNGTNIQLVPFEDFGGPLVDFVESLSNCLVDKEKFSITIQPKTEKIEVAVNQPGKHSRHL